MDSLRVAEWKFGVDCNQFGDTGAIAFVVIRATLFVLLMAAASLAEPAWQQALTPPTPGNFPQPKSVRASYRFGWMGLTAGAAEATFLRVTPEQLRLDVKGGTIGFVRTLWRLDATHVAYANAATLRPISVRQREIYPGQTIRTEMDFDDECVMHFHGSTRDQTPAKSKRFKFPNLYDMRSALLF